MAHEHRSQLPWEATTQRRDTQTLLNLAQGLRDAYDTHQKPISHIGAELNELERIIDGLPEDNSIRRVMSKAQTDLVSYLVGEAQSPNTDLYCSVRRKKEGNKDKFPTHVVFFLKEPTEYGPYYRTYEVKAEHLTKTGRQNLNSLTRGAKEFFGTRPHEEYLQDEPIPPLDVIETNIKVNYARRNEATKNAQAKKERGEEITPEEDETLRALNDEKYALMIYARYYLERNRNGGAKYRWKNGVAYIVWNPDNNILDEESYNNVTIGINGADGRRMYIHGNIHDLTRVYITLSKSALSAKDVASMLEVHKASPEEEIHQLKREVRHLEATILELKGGNRRNAGNVLNETSRLQKLIQTRTNRISVLESTTASEQPIQQPTPASQINTGSQPSKTSGIRNGRSETFEERDDDEELYFDTRIKGMNRPESGTHWPRRRRQRH